MKLGCGFKGEVVAVVLLIEILLELVVVMLLFLIPVAQFGLGGIAVTHTIVMHAVIFINTNSRTIYRLNQVG